MPENVNLHLCGTDKGGISVGKANTEDYSSEDYVPKFECEYPAYFYERVEQDFENHSPANGTTQEQIDYATKVGAMGQPFKYAIECGAGLIPMGGNFSSIEINTGKKWIDGKDIYMQVGAYTPFSSSGYNAQNIGQNNNINNIDTVVKIEGYFRTDNVVQTSTYTPGTVTNNIGIVRHYPGNRVLQIVRSAGSTVKGGGGVIWYTKK